MGCSEQETGGRAGAAPLSNDDLDILKFERQTWRHAGAKETAIRKTFGLSMTSYYQHVNRLIDNEAALAFDPILIRRLRGLREQRMSVRRDQARRI